MGTDQTDADSAADRSSAVAVLEIGGTHVVAALVDPLAGRVLSTSRHHLDSAGTAASIVDTLARAAEPLGARPSWGVAVPGPFDYRAGVGRFAEVGKFDALAGFDLGAALRSRLAGTPTVEFLNDADAFGIGEVRHGAGRGHRRAVCLTIGTGIGSAFIADGRPVNEGPCVPPDGSVHLLRWQGRYVEETVSRRGLRHRYAELTGTELDVHEIADLARDGDAAARETFAECFHALGACLGPWIARFEATALVLGGSIAQSVDLVADPLRSGIVSVEPDLTIRPQPAEHLELAALLGAAAHAAQQPALRARS